MLKAILTYVAICSFLLGIPFGLAYLFLPEKLKTKSLDATLDVVQVNDAKKLPKVLGEDHAKMAEAASDPNAATSAPAHQVFEEVKLNESQVEYVNPQTLDTINSLNIPDDLRNQLLQVYYSTGDVPGLRKPSSSDEVKDANNANNLASSDKSIEGHSGALHNDRFKVSGSNSAPIKAATINSNEHTKKTLTLIEANQQLRKISQETGSSKPNQR